METKDARLKGTGWCLVLAMLVVSVWSSIPIQAVAEAQESRKPGDYIGFEQQGTMKGFYYEVLVLEGGSLGYAEFECESTEMRLVGKTPSLFVGKRGVFPRFSIKIKPGEEAPCQVRVKLKSKPDEKDLLILGPRVLFRSIVRSDGGYKYGVAVIRGKDWPARFRDEIMVFQSGGYHSFWFDPGAEIVIDGEIKILGILLNIDPAYPLVFKMTSDSGWVLLCGRGAATMPDGQVHKLGDEGINDWLVLLKSRVQLAREAAAQALGWLAKTNDEKNRAVPALIQSLKDPSMEVRRNAAEALGRIGDIHAIEPLRLSLQDKEDWVRDVAQEALKKLAK